MDHKDKDEETQLQRILGVDEKGSVSGKKEKGRLSMKLEIPKAEGNEGGGVGNQYMCIECGKVFDSGKGLGGHKRVHGPNYYKMKKEAAAGVEDPPLAPSQNNNAFACCLCGKVFGSIKGLFGHMSYHPERGWKGIKPPLQDPQFASSTSTVSDSSSVDLMGSLRGWPVTAKRCRSTYVAAAAASGSEKVVEEKMEEAVDHLSIMASSHPKKIESQIKSLITGGGKKKKKKKKKRRLAELNKEGEVVHLDHHNNNNQIQHVCITCNKCFPTYQALGGHRASHKFKAQVVETTDHEHERTTKMLEDSGSSKQLDHQCNICSKRFPTGQALGGHKRCHWTASILEPAPPPRILPFDLNQLPPPDQSDDQC